VDMIRRLDVAETIKTVDYLRYGFKLSTDLVERDGRVFWSDKYLDTEADRAVMDVTDMGFHRMPFSRLNFYNLVTSMRAEGGRLLLEGSVVNQLGRLSPAEDLTLTVSVRNRSKPAERRTSTVRDWTLDGDRLTYRTQIDLARALGPLDQPISAWDLRLELHRGDEVNVTTFAVDPASVPTDPIRVRGRLGGVAPGWVEPYVTIKMNLSLQQAEDTRATAVAARAQQLSMRARWSVRWRSSKAVGNNPALKAFAYKVFRRLPVKRGLVVFESHMGKQYSDSPRYIYEAAVAAGLDRLGLDPVWSFARSKAGFPTDVRLVRRDSWRYHLDLARAEFWVDNQGFPRSFARRRETTYVQTWHGTPLKRMGFDSPALERASAAVRRQQKAMMRRWSALLVPSEYFVETFVASYEYKGKLVRKGLPRNDALVRGADPDWVLAKKRELGLPTDRRLVLYCPTFRDRARRLATPYELPLDLEVLRRRLGDDYFLLVRTHYLDSVKVSNRFAPFVADVSRHHDVTELMLLADILVTDYSSVMFDFANTGKPMIFFAYDYEDYVRDERGTYVDLPEIAPGPVVATDDELVEALCRVDKDVAEYADRYAAFRERFCTYETGHAAEAVVADFLARGRS
jgi:CDP-glycerol glycerophosphotransferase